MVMHVADVDPFFALVKDFEMLSQVVPCGSKQGRQVVGFCQALFTQVSIPEVNTVTVCDSLAAAGSAFPTSHELFLGHWQADKSSFIDWFTSAAAPLQERTGCVPVLITGLAAADDITTKIFDSMHRLGEPVLVRMLLGDIKASAELVRKLVAMVDDTRKLPAWWPLFQASSNICLEEWQQFADLLGDYWRYACIAVDPFVSAEVREFIRWQTVVVQVPVGDIDGIGKWMQIPAGMLTAFPDGIEYSLGRYLESLPSDKKDILIVLGPSKPEWSVDYNIKRISAIKELMAQYGVTI